MFEAVITRMQLKISSSSASGITENTLGQTNVPLQEGVEGIGDRDMDLTLALSDECFGILPFSDDSDWLQSLFDMNDCSSQTGNS